MGPGLTCPFLRMVRGMAPIPNRPREKSEVTDWLAGRGGAVVTIVVVVLVIWAVVSEVIS